MSGKTVFVGLRGASVSFTNTRKTRFAIKRKRREMGFLLSREETEAIKIFHFKAIVTPELLK